MTNLSSTPLPPNEINSSVPPAWRAWLTYITVALMPLSINYERIGGERKSPLYLSPLDFLLPVLAILMILDLAQRQPWARFKFPQPAKRPWRRLSQWRQIPLLRSWPG